MRCTALSTTQPYAVPVCTIWRFRLEGRIAGFPGLIVDIDGLAGHALVGDRLHARRQDRQPVPAEIVTFRHGLAQAMPFGRLDGLGPGAVILCSRSTGR